MDRRTFPTVTEPTGRTPPVATDNVPATGDSNDSFDHDTPYLANAIAIYGGNGNSVTNDVVSGSEYRGNEFSDTSTSINTGRVGESIPQSVWQTCRWNSSFTYTIPGLRAGTSYIVKLDWAELTWTAGQRKFNVAINGTTVLSAFDVYATAGYKTAQ